MRARVLAVALLALVFAAPASAAPCWKAVTLDWAADGTVDGTYDRACYTQAIEHQRPDLRIYSSFTDDIRRALQRASAPGADTTDDTETTAVQETPSSGDTGGDSFPLPLLLLGGLAVLLVAAGAAGLLWRRFGGRPGTP